MNLLIKKSNISGTIKIPCSKSIAIRKIIIASLIEKETILENIDLSEDINATISVLQNCNIDIKYSDHKLYIKGSKYIKKSSVFDVGSSAATLRIMIPILLYYFKEIEIKCNKDLLVRPINPYLELFKNENIYFKTTETGYIIKGEIKSHNILISGKISSQFISGLSFFLIVRNQGGRIIIKDKMASKKYLILTLKTLRDAGFKIYKIFNKVISLKYKTTKKLKIKTKFVETDYTQASSFLTLASFNKNLHIMNLTKSSQPDYVIFKLLKKLNLKIVKDKKNLTYSIINQPKNNYYRKFKFNFKNNPDLVLNMAILCLNLEGRYIFKGIDNLRYKESDRLWSVQYYLLKFGAKPYYTDKKLIFYSNPFSYEIPNNNLSNDHRVIMMLTIAGLIKNEDFIVNNYKSCYKSYPSFFKDIEKIGGVMNEIK